MGFIGSLLGTSSDNTGAAGLNYSAGSAPIQTPTTVDQATQAYTQSQNALSQQNAFAQAVAAQNGLGSQANALQQQQALAQQLNGANAVGTQTASIGQQQHLAGQLAANNGAANQGNVYAQQQALANQYQGLANGTGPNPALAQLNQTTGANIAAQGALMAGQRGASQNVGLIARQAAQQGAATQQQAVGQGAILAAQQQIAGMQGLQAQQQALGNTAQAQIGNQANQQAAVTNAAANQVNQQAAAQAAAAGTAGTQVAQQQNAVNSNTGAQQQEQSNILNSINQQNSATVGNQSNINSVNGGVAQIAAKGQQGLLSGVGSSAGPGIMAALAANGGAVEDIPKTRMYADGGAVAGPSSRVGQYLINPNAVINPASYGNSAAPQVDNSPGQEFNFGKYQAKPDAMMPSDQTGITMPEMGGGQFTGGGASLGADTSGLGSAGASGLAGSAGGLGAYALAKGGKVPGKKVDAMVSPGEVYLNPAEVSEVAQGKKDPIKAGEKIKGKAKVKGNSYANDTIPKKLESGGIVLPRSVTESKHPHWAAHAFVKAIMAKKGGSLG